MLGHVGIGAREQQAEGGEVRVGRPHLLARQPPAAVVLRRPRASARPRGPSPPRARRTAGTRPRRHAASDRGSGCFCSSVPWAMSVGPSMPTPMTSSMPGTPARAISWLTMTCSTGPRPWPPYSTGHVTPASPASASLPCHARRASMLAPSSPCPLKTGACMPGAPRARPAPSRGTAPARECRSGPPRAPLAGRPVGNRDHTRACDPTPFTSIQAARDGRRAGPPGARAHAPRAAAGRAARRRRGPRSAS